jgi:hypothetical protein
MFFIKKFVKMFLLIISIYYCFGGSGLVVNCVNPYGILYTFPDGRFFFRQENNFKINTNLDSHIYNVIQADNLARCLYACASTQLCYMGVYDKSNADCIMYDFVATDLFLVIQSNAYTFFKGSWSRFCYL